MSTPNDKPHTCRWGRPAKKGYFLRGSEMPEHSIWRAMKSRCNNPRDKSFKNYGGRGIKVCDRWLKFENFLEDIGEKPAGMSLDRINNDGDYEPGNCRWADMRVQSNNKRNTKQYSVGDFTGSMAECARHMGISKELAHWRLKNWGCFIKEQNQI